MPTTVIERFLSPENQQLFNFLSPLRDFRTALARFRTEASPETSAILRNLRNKASLYGGGVGLGIEAQTQADLESRLRSSAMQNSLEAARLQAQIAQGTGKTRETVKYGPLEQVGRILGTAGQAVSLVSGGLGIAQQLQSMKDPLSGLMQKFTKGKPNLNAEYMQVYSDYSQGLISIQEFTQKLLEIRMRSLQEANP